MQNNFSFEPKSNNKKKFTSLVIREGWKSHWRSSSRNDNKEKKPVREVALFTYEKHPFRVDIFDLIKQDENIREMKRINSMFTFSSEEM